MAGYIIGIIIGACIIIWAIYVNLFYDKVVGTVIEGGLQSFDMCMYEYQGIKYESLAHTLFTKRVGKKEKIWVCRNNPKKAITNQWYWFGLIHAVIVVVFGIELLFTYYI
ncbi:MAG: hypothetical protein ACI4E1_00955 [Lachnospira sp.]